MRIALAQVNATVGDLDGNADLLVEWTAGRRRRAPAIVVFPEMMLTGYPVEDLALRASFVDASIAATQAAARRLADEGLGGVAVVTGYLDRQAGAQARVGLPTGSPLDAAALLHARRGGGHLGEAPPAELRRLRRVPVLRARQHAAGLPAARCGRRARRRGRRDLRGPVAGRRPGRGDPRRRRGAAGGAQRVAVRAGQGRHPAGAVPAAGPRGGRGAGLRRTWSAARTSWSSTATRSSSARTATLLARGPQFAEALVVCDLELPAADGGPGPPATRPRTRRTAPR